jgi:hypothetical protein
MWRVMGDGWGKDQIEEGQKRLYSLASALGWLVLLVSD